MSKIMYWTEENLSLLRGNYPTRGAKYCADLLGCSISVIYNKSHQLGIKAVIRHNRAKLKGKKFFRLLVLSEDHIDLHQQVMWKCLCDCGNIKCVSSKNLNNGHVKSCGCYHDETAKNRQISKLDNKRFGKLIAIKQTAIDQRRNYIWECRCDCGGVIYVTSGNLSSGHTKSCGNCGSYRRKVKTSMKALLLHQLLNNKGVHNYITKDKMCIDIAMVIGGKKIAIEYDEWYWHGNKQQKDKIKIDKLINKGWKVLQIKASRNLPFIKDVYEAIYRLIHDTNYVCITLEGWGHGPCFIYEKKLQR